MNVHPSAVVNPPGLATTEPFAPEALYELKIDTNGDAVADIAYRVRFAISEDGSQTATLRRAEGAQAAGRGSIKFPDGRRHSPHLPTRHGIVRIDFQNFQVGPDGLAQLSRPGQVFSTFQAALQMADVIDQ